MKLFFASVVALVTVHQASAAQTDTTVCAIVQNPRAFNGKSVRFRADVLTDWRHGTVLIDSNCKVGITLSSTTSVPQDQADALVRGVGHPMDGGRNRTATATFTGTFSWKPFAPDERQHSFQNAFNFDARSVHDIETRPRQ